MSWLSLKAYNALFPQNLLRTQNWCLLRHVPGLVEILSDYSFSEVCIPAYYKGYRDQHSNPVEHGHSHGRGHGHHHDQDELCHEKGEHHPKQGHLNMKGVKVLVPILRWSICLLIHTTRIDISSCYGWCTRQSWSDCDCTVCVADRFQLAFLHGCSCEVNYAIYGTWSGAYSTYILHVVW